MSTCPFASPVRVIMADGQKNIVFDGELNAPPDDKSTVLIKGQRYTVGAHCYDMATSTVMLTVHVAGSEVTETRVYGGVGTNR